MSNENALPEDLDPFVDPEMDLPQPVESEVEIIRTYPKAVIRVNDGEPVFAMVRILKDGTAKATIQGGGVIASPGFTIMRPE